MPMPVFIDEAKAGEKWCPFARSLGTLMGRASASDDDRTISVGASNRGYQMGGALHNCMCIGAKCMAWRFGKTHIKNPHTGDMALSEDTHGYCGLAGVPGA